MKKKYAFNLAKYQKRLEDIGAFESEVTPEEADQDFEDIVDEYPKLYSYQKTYRKLFRHLKLDATVFFCCILNIRKMESGRGRRGTAIGKFLKKSKGRASKALGKAIIKHPILANGWFRLPEGRLMRELYISRRVETRLIEVLKDAGLILTLVDGMPRQRWCRVNQKRWRDLLADDSTDDSEE